MKFGNPKIKSHNVQMNRKPIKDLKNMLRAKNNWEKNNSKGLLKKNAILSFSKVHN
jgi:hypothetical protein